MLWVIGLYQTQPLHVPITPPLRSGSELHFLNLIPTLPLSMVVQQETIRMIAKIVVDNEMIADFVTFVFMIVKINVLLI